jgi:hypothetical protein
MVLVVVKLNDLPTDKHTFINKINTNFIHVWHTPLISAIIDKLLPFFPPYIFPDHAATKLTFRQRVVMS